MIVLRHFVLLALLTGLLSACGSRPLKPSPAIAGQANAVLFRAIGLVGTPYRYGGNTPDGGFDCSGLVTYVYRESAGLSLPRTTRQIAALRAPAVDQQHLMAGDLVFFGKHKASHMGIYVGDGRFVHAPSTGGTVRLDRLDGPYWGKNYLSAKRILN